MRTTTSDETILITDALLPKGESSGARCSIIEVDKWSEYDREATAKVTPLTSLVQEYESDPRRRVAMERARNRIAAHLNQVTTPNNLREYRLRKGLSQTALAAQLGTTQAQIARIESARQDVQVSTLVRLAQALDMDPIDAVRVFLTQRDQPTR